MAIYKSKKPTKDGRQYFFRIKYKDVFGIVHDYSSSKYKNKKDAETEEARYRIKISQQETDVIKITLKQGYLDLRATKEKRNKKQSLIKDDNLFKYLQPLEDVTINNIDLTKYRLFIKELETKKISVAYKNKVLILFCEIIRHCSKYYNTSSNILKFVEKFKEINSMKKEMLFFTFEEYSKFDSVIDSFEYHTLFELLYYMGLRQGEAQALTWDSINFNKGTLKITKTLTTKIKGERYTISSPKTKNSIRELPIPNKLLNDFKIMYENAKQYKDFDNNWFVFGNSLPFPETTIQKKKNDYCNKAEVKQIRIHDFRHSCASLLINQGATIALVSKWLGHSDITTTLNTYTHMYKSELENITNLINSL